MRVAYQGEPGAFSHEACALFLPECEAVPKASFADVYQCVASGETELGMLPEENSAAGIVPEVAALLDRGGLTIVARHVLPIHMHLMTKKGATWNSVAIVASHPIALAQCAQTIRNLGLVTEEALNTAGAAKQLAEGDDLTRGVLASEAAAETYGLSILRRDMQDRPDNATRFVVLSRDAASEPAR